jgi:hypothetical protein
MMKNRLPIFRWKKPSSKQTVPLLSPLNISNWKSRLLIYTASLIASLLKRTFLVSLCSLLLIPFNAQAHREKTVLTTITCNPRTELLEIVHRTFAHDVEHTLGNHLQAQGGLDNLEAQARISVELSNSFMLWDSKGKKIPLTLIGAELVAEYFFIYQEAPCSTLSEITSVRHEMLRNYWPDMTNYLNVYFAPDADTGTRSLIFASDSGIQTL